MFIFRTGKIVRFIPAISFEIARPSFYKGVSISLILWHRGWNLTITTKRAYLEFKEKERANIERIQREKANPPT